MTTFDDLDGRIGEGWGGEAPNGCHVNVVLARRGSPTAAAAIGMLAHPAPGHTPVLVCVGPTQQEYEPVWPPTLMMNKATALDARHQTMTWGAAQLGIGQGVLDAVADGLIEATGDLLVLVAVWVDADADDETALRAASRAATRKALGTCVEGGIRPPPRRSWSDATRFGTRSTAVSSAHRRHRDAQVPLPARAAVPRRVGPRAQDAPGRDVRHRPLRRRSGGIRERRRSARPRPPGAALLGVDLRRSDVVHGICETVDFHHGRNWTLEVAVWDLVARSEGLPLWRLLGGETDRLLAYASTGELVSADVRTRRCVELRDAGVRAVKIRLHSNDWRIDLPVIEAVRDAVGSDMDIMVDANQGWRMPGDLTPRWDLPTAAAFAQELHRLDVYWLEEPLPTSDVDEYATLCRSSDVRIAAGEMVRSAAEAQEHS